LYSDAWIGCDGRRQFNGGCPGGGVRGAEDIEHVGGEVA